MKNFIKALNILLKYENPDYPFHCEHDILYICISPKNISLEDIKKLDDLQIHADYEEDHFFSYHYGSA
jgi:hypothetical protein